MIDNYGRLAHHILAAKVSKAIRYPLFNPISVTIHITGKCYSRCKVCNVWKNQDTKNELTSEEWEKVFRNVGRSAIWFTFSGGEPMLREDLPQIILHVSTHCDPKYINIATSGIYPQRTYRIVKEIIDSLNDKTKLTINLSIDGIGKDNDLIRGVPGGYEKIKETARLLRQIRKKNLILGVNTVVSKYNYRNFISIYDSVKKNINPDSYVCELGASRRLLGTIDDPKPPDTESIKIFNYLKSRTDQIQEAWVTGYFRKKYYSLVASHLSKRKKALDCYAGYASCDITATGEVIDCCVNAKSMGNLRDNGYSLIRVLRSEQAKEARDKIKDCYCNTANPNYTNLLCNLRL